MYLNQNPDLSHAHYRLLFLSLLSIVLFACEDDDDPVLVTIDRPDDVPGLNYVADEDGDFASIYDTLITILEANPNITIVAEVDHRANATIAGETLDPTRVVLFGNPRLGTPLMQLNPRAGLDLPQRMLVYQTEQDEIILAYTTADYLASRHGVQSAATVGNIRDALRNLATSAAGGDVEIAEDNEVSLDEGITSFSAPGQVDSVYAKLRTAISDNANLTIAAQLDHQANAASVGLTLNPSKLIVFGNPRLGTPLIAAQ